MPIRVTTTAGGTNYANPLVGPADHVAHVKLDISGMTTDEVDTDGYLKPGVLLTKAGILVGVAPAFPFGVVFEAIKVASGNTALAGDTSDPLVAVCTHGIINRDLAEDNLGRAYNANEIASCDLAGSHLVLTTT